MFNYLQQNYKNRIDQGERERRVMLKVKQGNITRELLALLREIDESVPSFTIGQLHSSAVKTPRAERRNTTIKRSQKRRV